MGKIDRAMREIDTLDQLARRDQILNRMDPCVKLFVTVFYIVLTVSFGKYNLTGLLCMCLYPFFVFQIGDLSFRDALRRLRIVLPVVCIVGILNPFFDREILFRIGTVGISGGVISMITLMLKGILTVLASYLLIASTTIEEICAALRKIHVPQILVVEVLLIYRYISVLLGEAHRITQAYSLRAPGQKGVAFRAWGPLLGQLLLRSMDRAGEVYESMCLRGFHGEFYPQKRTRTGPASALYLIVWAGILTLLRFVPVAEWIGHFFVKR